MVNLVICYLQCTQCHRVKLQGNMQWVIIITQMTHSCILVLYLDQVDALKALEECIAEVRGWMLLNMLKLNYDKTEFLLIVSPYNIKKASSPSLVIGNTEVHSVTQVKNLTLDAAKSLMHTYVTSRLDYANSMLLCVNKGLV